MRGLRERRKIVLFIFLKSTVRCRSWCVSRDCDVRRVVMQYGRERERERETEMYSLGRLEVVTEQEDDTEEKSEREGEGRGGRTLLKFC